MTELNDDVWNIIKEFLFTPPKPHKIYEVGRYLYPDFDTDNGRIINIFHTTKKTMTYEIGNFYDNNIKNIKILEKKRVMKKTHIILHLTRYYPEYGIYIGKKK